MRIVRFAAEGTTRYGVLDKDVIHSFRVSPFSCGRNLHSTLVADGGDWPSNRVAFLSPCTPSKIVCLGLNYHHHAKEIGLSIPSVPLIFLKPSTSTIGPDDSIVIPRLSKCVDYEGELAVVIACIARNVPEERATEYIFGYTCFNDVTERTFQQQDGQWTRSKSYDTFAPIGPWIETDITPDNLEIKTFVNGQLRQHGRTSDLIFGIPKLISFISDIMTLLPGDVIATGTPYGIGSLNGDDVVEVTISKIGTLRNPVIAST